MPPGRSRTALNAQLPLGKVGGASRRPELAATHLQRWIVCSLEAGADGALPSEFRIFVAGANDTSHGVFLFDAEAAKAVMAHYAARGVEVMIDLEHQSITDAKSPDPTARDARGWCKLALRNGELWAVNVKWTPDGAARLSERRQRYISPAFGIDPETKRVTSLLNVAIVAMPATHDTPALVAASDNGGSAMTLEEFMKVCKALGLDGTMKLEDVMSKIKGGDTSSDPEDAPPPAGDGGADETTETAGDKPAKPPMGADGAPPAPDAEKKEEVAASLASMMRTTGAKTFVEMASIVKTFHTSHLELETERLKLSSERKVLESAERRKTFEGLVVASVRKPAEIWKDPLAKNLELKDHYVAMPIEAVRSYAADAIKASGRAPTPIAPPRGQQTGTGAIGPHGLDERELAICKETNCDPAMFATLKARRAGTAT